MSIDALSGLLCAEQCPRLVIKVGSSLLVRANGAARSEWLATLVGEIAEAKVRGQDVIVVSSGAIALGASRLGLANGGRGSLSEAQAAASVGQVALARLWSQALEPHGLTAAQILLTLDDLEDRARYLNAAATLEQLLANNAVPVVNENDSVATEEIRFGDNDRLAARVAQAARADAVLLLSDVDGLFDRAPNQDGAQLIERVEGVSPEMLALADRSSGSGIGSGGMLAKLEAARIAERAGIALVIASGVGDAPIGRAVESGKGTLFVPREGVDARKAWLDGRLAPAGTLCVDEGCALALAKNGASVLAVGIIAVEGSFQRGDLVEICGPDKAVLGKGLSEYDAISCRRIAGLREDQQAKILGHAPRAAVVHRDHMVLA